MNIRVADSRASYEDWQREGVKFLIDPKDYALEIRCYLPNLMAILSRSDKQLVERYQGLIKRWK
jgi:hypothetical protein